MRRFATRACRATAPRAKPLRMKRGSVAIEAAIALSAALIVLLTAFGTLLSIYVDDEVQWGMLGVRDSLAMSSVVFSGSRTEWIDTALLGLHGNLALGVRLEERELCGLIDTSGPLIPFSDGYGSAVLDLRYRYRFGTIQPENRFVIPAGGVLRSDGIDFEDSTVYITDTGIRYHRSDCFHLRKSKHGIPLKEALKRGYTPCRNCMGR